MFLYFKLGSKRDMVDLLENGTIYCNPLSFFAKQDNSGRFDTDELVINVTTEFDGKTTLYSEDGVKMRIYSRQTKDVVLNPLGNLYCLYTLNIENVPLDRYHRFHPKMKDFGTHVVIIKDSVEFMKRLLNQLNSIGIESNRNFINYVSMRDFQGKKNIFTKDLSYRHQQEYRIHLHTPLDIPYKFQIGNIEDISEMEEIERITEFSMKDGNGSVN
jgi:hypothetical protein